jgi:hypothetical protein
MNKIYELSWLQSTQVQKLLANLYFHIVIESFKNPYGIKSVEHVQNEQGTHENKKSE